MREEKLKTFQLDGDLFTVPYHFDEGAGIFIGLFPSFEEEPRYTPNDRPSGHDVHMQIHAEKGRYV